jgi:hypothetical protein
VTTTTEEDTMITLDYLAKLPAEIPPGRVLVHSHVYPVAIRAGARGSRYWLADPSPGLEPCPCGWAAELGAHYRITAVARRQGLAPDQAPRRRRR